ncbi:MAG: NB-ARC domain-containing protein [Pseudomonadota bacterium]
MPTNQFAQLVDDYLTREATKLEAIASEIGICRQTLSSWRRGNRAPRCKNVLKFAQLLGLNGTETEELLKAAGCDDSSPPDNALARQDLAEMPDLPVLYGRTKELETLTQWSITCRLVAILGIGGIGKTALAAKLVKDIQNQFQYIIWKSLREAPPVKNLLADAIKFLSNNQEIDLPDSLGKSITRLIYYLNRSRCLLILDNFESIFQTNTHVGAYLKGYEGYDDLIKRVSESSHQSCLVLTSREKPVEVALFESSLIAMPSSKPLPRII